MCPTVSKLNKRATAKFDQLQLGLVSFNCSKKGPVVVGFGQVQPSSNLVWPVTTATAIDSFMGFFYLVKPDQCHHRAKIIWKGPKAHWEQEQIGPCSWMAGWMGVIRDKWKKECHCERRNRWITSFSASEIALWIYRSKKVSLNAVLLCNRFDLLNIKDVPRSVRFVIWACNPSR